MWCETSTLQYVKEVKQRAAFIYLGNGRYSEAEALFIESGCDPREVSHVTYPHYTHLTSLSTHLVTPPPHTHTFDLHRWLYYLMIFFRPPQPLRVMVPRFMVYPPSLHLVWVCVYLLLLSNTCCLGYSYGWTTLSCWSQKISNSIFGKQ